MNGVDPLGLFCLLGTNPGGGCRGASEVKAVGRTVASGVKKYDPAYKALQAYDNEYHAAQDGCSLLTDFKYAGEAVGDDVETFGILAGGAGAGADAVEEAGADGASGAIAAARGGATGAESSGISLDQAAAAAERNGLDLSGVDLSYEAQGTPGYIPGAYGYSIFSGDETPLLNEAGNMQIVLQDAGLASEEDAVATIAHEMAHLTMVGPYDEEGAEAYARQIMGTYIP